MKITDLRPNQMFTFPHAPRIFYMNRGNGWYSSVSGCDGGPWHTDRDTIVNPVDNLADQWEQHLAHVAHVND